MPEVCFTLNGEPVRVLVDDGEPLLHTLRERLGITSVKEGCQPQGQCGACVAIVNGHARATCNEPTTSAHDVVTLEGLPAEERERIVRAFESHAAGQCGYCLPGIALHAVSFLAQHPSPTRAEIAKGLDMHLCRCGGYSRIITALETLAKLRRGEPAGEPCAFRDSDPRAGKGGVGARVARLDSAPIILGKKPFVKDIRKDGMLHGALVLSDYARAKVLSIDTTAAAALPGVVAVLTAKDIPGERWQGLIERDWPVMVAVGEEVRCGGDVLCAVAAVDEPTAREAASLVEVDYEVYEPIVSPEAALAENAPRVNPRHDNLLGHSAIRRGEPEAALAASAHVGIGTYQTQRIEHLFIELECAVAEPRGNGVSVLSQGQGVFDDRNQIASLLGIPREDVLVTMVPSGGGFGGKEDMTVQGHAALLAFVTKRPVRVALDREESVKMHPKRHPISIEMELGCDAEGNFTALRARLLGDSGAYASVGAKVLERAAGHACGPYRVPHVDIESRAAYTNHPPCGAMRGFGVCQVTFALEACIDQLAKKTGIDGWELRYRNAVKAGDPLTSGQRLSASVGIRRTLEAVKPAWDAAKAAGRAAGIACGIKNSGLGNGAEEWGKACLVVLPDRQVALHCGFTEMGQGLWTALAQIAAEATGLPLSTIHPSLDTRFELGAGQTTGSRALLLGGRAVIAASQKLRAALDAGATLESLEGKTFQVQEGVLPTTPLGADVPSPRTHTTYGFATQVVILDEKGHLQKVVAAHDVGRAINPSLCEAQVEGAIVMGLGYALTEELPCEDGIPSYWSVRELGPLRARDVPEIEVMLIEEHEPEGPFGAKGVGEIGLVPTAAAVAGALESFDGVRRTRLPMKDSPASKWMHTGHLHANAHTPGHVGGPHSHGPHSYGPHSHGAHCHGHFPHEPGPHCQPPGGGQA